MRRVGDVKTVWGESLVWDDRRERLYFVDVASHMLHWLEGGEPPRRSLTLPGRPTGVVLAEDGRLVICLDDGLHLVDADVGTWRLLGAYPEAMHGRANDAAADGHGNLVTGTLNLGPGPGAHWWFSAQRGWRLLGEDAGNANGPQVLDVDGEPTLLFADTLGRVIHAFPYDGANGAVGARRVFADTAVLGGMPDGSAVDADGGLWTCQIRAGRLVRLTQDGPQRTVELPAANPSDAAFGGPALDRLFVSTIALDLDGEVPLGAEAGRLLVLDGLGVSGRAEPRFAQHRA